MSAVSPRIIARVRIRALFQEKLCRCLLINLIKRAMCSLFCQHAEKHRAPLCIPLINPRPGPKERRANPRIIHEMQGREPRCISRVWIRAGPQEPLRRRGMALIDRRQSPHPGIGVLLGLALHSQVEGRDLVKRYRVRVCALLKQRLDLVDVAPDSWEGVVEWYAAEQIGLVDVGSMYSKELEHFCAVVFCFYRVAERRAAVVSLRVQVRSRDQEASNDHDRVGSLPHVARYSLPYRQP
ncbi:hypothetical protein BJX68DRAFT_262481 [Aspergillus pseudodeflectus]|uniref:Uncharacterized protein n=1 Tax=Aspergillus pseudodeflectus TaxID=176178 RepID=A0ABR4L388_9EURO